ncbi:nuclear transport factor 2 family protein [Sinisalibacter aestuarii]|uniref:SnoaL-like domain-containing protein n=1 Tax=Sinisalibacter aestuarii TaxID=2949426 RepID=A0ABQ5LRN0_9RHOB|nr:nuclear transport factor 2 family protein [Sinisalibacter aestuarii]GKY87388.1 hypothetical protein STA1M1_12570 [Sinisalibacter aestuarii]
MSSNKENGMPKGSDIAEIMNVFFHYSHAIDSARLDEMAALWTEDGGGAIYYRHPNGKDLIMTDQQRADGKASGCAFTGRANIASYMAGLGVKEPKKRSPGPNFDGGPTIRHFISNIWVKEVVGDTAKATAYWWGDDAPGGPGDEKRGTYEWFLKRVDGEWKIHWSTWIVDGPRDFPCTLADDSIPLPEDGTFGVTPNKENPDF